MMSGLPGTPGTSKAKGILSYCILYSLKYCIPGEVHAPRGGDMMSGLPEHPVHLRQKEYSRIASYILSISQ